MTAPYQPEIGQHFFGQPSQPFAASNLLSAAIQDIRRELVRVSWNKHQKELLSPFDMANAQHFDCPTFSVDPYSWDDEKAQPWNFKWKDLLVSWYKHSLRGLSVNRPIEPAEISTMLDECLEALRKMDQER